MRIDLSERSALVTGGSRGIGRAISGLLGSCGARVTIGYHEDDESARGLVSEIRGAGGEAHAVRADLSRTGEPERLVQAARDRFGGPDILVNNAGIWRGAPVEALTDADWSETLTVNLEAAFRTCRTAVPGMKKRRRGRIVNISSTAGQRGEAGYSAYAASKGAVIAFTKSLAVELAPFGVTVNAVAPGWVETDMTAGALGGPGGAAIEGQIPLGRVGRPEEIAGPVVFLCSDAATFITGEVLNVNGGAVLCG